MAIKLIGKGVLLTAMLYLTGAFVSAEWNSAEWFPLLRIIIGFLWLSAALGVLANEVAGR